MSRLLNVMMVVFCINIALYMGGFQLFEDDVIDLFFKIGSNENNTGFSESDSIIGFSQSLNGSIPPGTQIAGADDAASDFRITDVPKTIFSMFLFLGNMMFAPIAIFTDTSLSIPTEIQFMIALPLAVIMIFVVINWWRGND